MCHKVLEEDLIVRIDVILRVEGGVVWMEVGCYILILNASIKPNELNSK